MDNAIIIGKGMVGKATMRAFGITDFIDISESTMTYKEARAKKKFFFICVPTPTDAKGDCDISAVKDTISAITSQEGEQPIIIIRSTIYPGACKYLMSHFSIRSIVHYPEFLTESTWKQDVGNPDLIVIGAEDGNYAAEVEALIRSRYKTEEISKTDTATSETLKYAINCFYALKVVYANQIFDFCQKSGANYGTIKNCMYRRKWIGKNHLEVWFKHGLEEEPNRGIRGKCLPKDLEAFVNYSKSKLLKTVKELNDVYVA